MTGNYPPGVTGSEWQITGADPDGPAYSVADEVRMALEAEGVAPYLIEEYAGYAERGTRPWTVEQIVRLYHMDKEDGTLTPPSKDGEASEWARVPLDEEAAR